MHHLQYTLTSNCVCIDECSNNNSNSSSSVVQQANTDKRHLASVLQAFRESAYCSTASTSLSSSSSSASASASSSSFAAAATAYDLNNTSKTSGKGSSITSDAISNAKNQPAKTADTATTTGGATAAAAAAGINVSIMAHSNPSAITAAAANMAANTASSPLSMNSFNTLNWYVCV